MFRFVAILMILIGGGTAGFSQTIEVTETGTVVVEPDMATVVLEISNQHKKAKKASQETDLAVRSLLDALKKMDIPTSDIKTTYINLHQLMDHNALGAKVVGFVSEHHLTVTTRDLDMLGDLIETALESGANEIHGITFDVQNRASFEAEAKVLAVQNAKSEARLLAEAAGVKLGKINYIVDGVRAEFRGGPEIAQFRSSGMTAAAGTLEISATVKLYFDLVAQ